MSRDHERAAHLAENALLALLDDAPRLRLLPHFAPVTFASGEILQRQGDAVAHAYFPCAGFVATTLSMPDDDADVVIGLVGREGVVACDGPPFSGASTVNHVAVMAGMAWRIPLQVLHELTDGTTACGLLSAYRALCHAAAQQAAACHLLHDVESRLCGWLLVLAQGLDGDSIPLTHVELAALTGIRRTTVTQIAGALQAAGILDNRRGRLRIADRFALESSACACYRAMHERRALFDAQFATRG